MAANKKLLGRPLMTDGKRTKKVDARFTEDEYKIVLALEKELGVKKSDLVRTRLLQNAPVVVVNAKEIIRQLDNIGTELGRSGNNINQLAKYGNILIKNDKVSPVIIERFNFLFEQYINNQRGLEIVLRKVIRIMGH
jgi:hypothetical protein